MTPCDGILTNHKPCPTMTALDLSQTTFHCDSILISHMPPYDGTLTSHNHEPLRRHLDVSHDPLWQHSDLSQTVFQYDGILMSHMTPYDGTLTSNNHGPLWRHLDVSHVPLWRHSDLSQPWPPMTASWPLTWPPITALWPLTNRVPLSQVVHLVLWGSMDPATDQVRWIEMQKWWLKWRWGSGKW